MDGNTNMLKRCKHLRANLAAVHGMMGGITRQILIGDAFRKCYTTTIMLLEMDAVGAYRRKALVHFPTIAVKLDERCIFLLNHNACKGIHLI